jgi:hypothetical protein
LNLALPATLLFIFSCRIFSCREDRLRRREVAGADGVDGELYAATFGITLP